MEAPAMAEGLSTVRLYVMRTLYGLNFLLLGSDVWPRLLTQQETWDPVYGAAYSFWGALSLLSALGLRYPLQMLPLLLLQFVYKSIWLTAVGPSLWAAGRSTGMTEAFAIGIVLDLVAIPWPYVFVHYVKRRGDRWKRISDAEQ
jgi:hypothetical protein